MKHKEISKIKEKSKDYVIYCDTDSVSGDSIVDTNLYGKVSLDKLFDELYIDNLPTYFDINEFRQFIFPSDLKLPYYDEENCAIETGLVQYIERHFAKKELFKISTSDTYVVVTDDHSLMIFANDKLTKYTAKECEVGHSVIVNKNGTKCISQIVSIESMGEVDTTLYDIGMSDTPHTFFANDMLVHNSIFCSALPLIKKFHPDVDENNEKEMSSAILSVTGDVQQFINDCYNIMAKSIFNIENHRFDIKQEVISKTSIWIAKKRYAQFIINNGGVEVDELEVKGLDVVRTSFPFKFREFMKEFLQDVLKKVPEKEITDKIVKFKEEFVKYPIIEIAKNTSVKFISSANGTNYDPVDRSPFASVKGAPVQVKSALFYNDLIKHLKLDNSVELIIHGQKIKWVYLKQNEYNIDCIALKADDTDPQEVLDFIEKYVDKNAMYVKELKSKLEDFYNVLKWEFPNDSYVAFTSFFEEV